MVSTPSPTAAARSWHARRLFDLSQRFPSFTRCRCRCVSALRRRAGHSARRPIVFRRAPLAIDRTAAIGLCVGASRRAWRPGDVLRGLARRGHLEDDERRQHVEACLRRCSRRIGWRRGSRAVGAKHRVRRNGRPVRLVVHCRQRRLQIDGRRKNLEQRRATQLTVHRRGRRFVTRSQRRARRRARTRRTWWRAGQSCRRRGRARSIPDDRRRRHVDACAPC